VAITPDGRVACVTNWDSNSVSVIDAATDTVAAVVPARNEADVIERSVTSLLAQDYPGPLRVIVVDDSSDDGTAERALAAGAACAGVSASATGASRPTSRPR
jgi:YVTN family beta-propeller protein